MKSLVPPAYFVVGAIAGLLFGATIDVYGFWLAMCVYLCFLIPMAWIDFKYLS